MFDGIPIGTLTAPTLLGIGILFVLTGRLLPRFIWKDKDNEAERWRQAYEAEREARVTADKQVGELLELAKTTHALISGLFTNTERIRQSGETDAVPKA